jgi:glycosyltransferase involved in cell wall biosynthesis
MVKPYRHNIRVNPPWSMSSQSAAISFSPAPQRSLTVSVIVPVYNAERWLASTLISVLQQDYEAFEVIAVDDGSHDQSVAILTRFAQQDQRVRLVQQLHQGVAAARNRAIALATGDLIAPIDADDLWHPQFLAQHVQQYSRAPQIAVSYCWSLDVNHQDQWSGGFQAATIAGSVHDTLLCHYFLGNGSCTVIRREALQAIGGYRSGFGVTGVPDPAMGQAVCEDWDLYLRLAEQYAFGVVPQFYVGYRQHPHSASRKVDRMAYWHQQLLRDRRQRQPHLRPWIWRLSQRSFGRYLQQQARPITAPLHPPNFPLQGPLAWPDRARIHLKLRLAGLLHWAIRHFGQRHRHARPHL